MGGFYNQREEYAAKFYQVPQVFFTSELYENLSNDSKIAYGLLLNRHSLSQKNKWFDSEGNYYFIYSNDDLARILKLSVRTVTKIRKELTAANLLFCKRLGQGFKDRLYLKRPVVTESDIYKIDNPEIEEPETVGGVEKRKICVSRNAEFAELETQNLRLISKTEYSKTDFSDTDSLKSFKDDDDKNNIYRESQNAPASKKAENKKSAFDELISLFEENSEFHKLYLYLVNQMQLSDDRMLELFSYLKNKTDWEEFNESDVCVASAGMRKHRANVGTPMNYFGKCISNARVARMAFPVAAGGSETYERTVPKVEFYNWLEIRD